jgi:hypothetical protein
MAKHPHKRFFGGLVILTLFLTPLFNLSAQVVGDVVTGGSMEEADADSWNVEILFRDATQDTPEYLFGSKEDCDECEEGTLEIWAAGTGHTNIVFWQKVTLKANRVYRANAAYASLDHDAANNWLQLKVGIDSFPLHENDQVKLLGTNFWEGCGQTDNGLLQEIACDGIQAGPDGYGFLTPDTIAEFEAYFAIVAGMWTASTPIPYSVVVDEVVLIDSIEAASVSVGPEMTNKNATLINFPNPFEQKTTILYDLPSRSDVKLTVYNLLGQEIANLYEGVREAGTHRAELDVSAVSNNVLICKLEYGNRVLIRKMTRLK